MNLKKSIVVVSEFTVKDKRSRKGSRGSTPGRYVTNYMARSDAVETCAPVKLFESDDYLLRYVARDEATETLLDRDDVKPTIRKLEGKGGIAFGKLRGREDVSLSDERLKEISKTIQTNYDAGKTIIKTVLSFEEEYLREMGIIEPDFKCENDGDYRGNIDQMKLRMSIMHGLDRMGVDYDNLTYVGVIQVDTQHVHCHLAMVDAGRGKLTHESEQIGKISVTSRRKLRRGIDNFLNEHKAIAFMKSSVDLDRRNTALFVRRSAYKTLLATHHQQFLLSCLPENQNMWRAGSNSREMRKANTIVREIVRKCLEDPKSGYDKVKEKSKEYADYRRKREDLTPAEYKKLITDYEKKVEDDCVNSIYETLRTIKKSQKQIRTPFLDAMSMGLDSMDKNGCDLECCVYNLRSYTCRIKRASKQRKQARHVVQVYEQAVADGKKVEESRPVYDFFKNEEEYQSQILSKYRHFLAFAPPSSEYEDEYEDLLRYRQRCIDINNMFNDVRIKRFRTPAAAEAYGEKTYNQAGGEYMKTQPSVIQDRRDVMFINLARKYDELNFKLAEDGLLLDIDENDTAAENVPMIRRGVKHQFKDVKALDLHHLESDIEVPDKSRQAFLQAAAVRIELFKKAKQYLEASGQESALSSLPVADVELMEQTARRLINGESLGEKADAKSSRYTRSATVTLDYDAGIEQTVDEVLSEIERDYNYFNY